MMRRLGGFLLVALGVALMIAQGVHASERGTDSFDNLVRALSKHYDLQPKTIPMMWAVSLCARGATHGGVRGMKVVEFENAMAARDGATFEDVVGSKIGEDWSRMVREWERDGDESLVYVRAENRRIDLIVVDLKHGELNLVKMTMDPDQFAKWTREKERRVMVQ